MTTSEGALCRDLDGAPAKAEVASETMKLVSFLIYFRVYCAFDSDLAKPHGR